MLRTAGLLSAGVTPREPAQDHEAGLEARGPRKLYASASSIALPSRSTMSPICSSVTMNGGASST